LSSIKNEIPKLFILTTITVAFIHLQEKTARELSLSLSNPIPVR
jgi:hypothetical protein